MRGFVYTLILTAVLVASVAYLRSLQEPAGVETRSSRSRPMSRSPMGVKSEPAVQSTIDTTELQGLTRDALYQTGVELLDLWHLPEAIDVLRKVADNDSSDYHAQLKLVECYSNPVIGNERLARQAWKAAWDSASRAGRDTVWVKAFRGLFLNNNPPLAATRFAESGTGRGDPVEAKLYLAMALLDAGRSEEAEEGLEGLLEDDPSLGRARELLVRCKVASGKYGEAESHAKELAAIYPEEPYPYVLLSRVQLVLGDIEEAIEFCNNALLLDERYIPAIVARAHLYAAAGDWEAAKVSFEKLQLFDDPMRRAIGFEGIAYVYFLSGDFDKASQAMDEAIRLAMSSGSTHRGLAYAFCQVDYLCELGRYDAAEAVLDRWVSRSGRIPAQLGQLRIRISEGEIGGAQHALDEIRNDERWRSWMRLLAIDYDDTEAFFFIKESRFAEALALLQSGADVAPSTRRAYLKGYASFETGDAESAASAFEEAQTRFHSLEFPYHSDPVLYVQSKYFLAEASIATGENGLAEQYYREFLDLWGDATWQLQAVDRAKQKLEALSGKPVGG